MRSGSTRGVSYRTPDGEWRRAAIHVADTGVRVYARKHLSLVLTYSGFDYAKRINGRAIDVGWDAGLALLGGIAVVGSLALPVEPGWRETCFSSGYCTSCSTEWIDGRDRRDVWRCSGGRPTIQASRLHVHGWAQVDYCAGPEARSGTVRTGALNPSHQRRVRFQAIAYAIRSDPGRHDPRGPTAVHLHPYGAPFLLPRVLFGG